MLEWCLLGVRLRMGVWFPASVVVMLSLDHSGMTLLCLLASTMHECGHLLAMLLLGDLPSCVTFGAFGMRVEHRTDRQLSYRRLCIVSLSGPLVNAVCGAWLWAVGAADAAWIHSILAVFHLLPVVSLDGGEALYALLCCHLAEERADRLVRLCSAIAVFPLTALGVWLLLSTGYNATLLVVCGYLLLRMFLRTGH